MRLRVKVRCPRCAWVGYRTRGEESYGLCVACQIPVLRDERVHGQARKPRAVEIRRRRPLSPADVQAIRDQRAAGVSLIALAVRYRRKKPIIARIVAGEMFAETGPGRAFAAPLGDERFGVEARPLLDDRASERRL